MKKYYLKSFFVFISLVFAGYTYECDLNPKIDEELCSILDDTSTHNFYKFNIILKRPVIDIPDTLKDKPGKNFSKYYQDSLSRYLDAKKEVIKSIVTDNVLYTVKSSKENPERLTKCNMNIDFQIPAAASRETILAIAEKYDIIVRIETYKVHRPTIQTEKNKR